MKARFRGYASKTCLFALLLLTALANDVEAQTKSPGLPSSDPSAAGTFPRFHFAGDPETSEAASRFLHDHFINRMHNDRVIFNKEYLMKADLWLDSALDGKRGKSIQEVHREDLLGIEVSPDGYVHTHQHFSHTHDHGWPFPYWLQIPATDEATGQVVGRFQGLTAGWHFQHERPQWDILRLLLQHTPGAGQHLGDAAMEGWELTNLESGGIVDGAWQLRATARSPVLTTPAGVVIQAEQAPFLQIRWTRDGDPPSHQLPFVEWMRKGDDDFSPERRVYIPRHRSEDHESLSNARHDLMTMHTHPQWQGTITRLRFHLSPGESDVRFRIDSIFTVYDTRKQHNNAIYVLASGHYFRWTGDLDFLQRQMPRMRLALRYLETVMGGRELGHIRNPWVGNDGLPSFVPDEDGNKVFHPGRGLGNNYFDLLPFGWDDAYATAQYHASLRVMADLEEAAAQNPGWQIPAGADRFDPADLRAQAERVKRKYNELFWDPEKKRYFGVIDKEGNKHDYGFVFLNLDAIWYGLATPERARAIMDWIDGRRIIEGDTSTGEDIYFWEFAPRSTTKRNIWWYGQAWNMPERIPFGGQVQDGGAVLGFSFYDIWARLQVFGPDDAWERFRAIMKWDSRIQEAGGYRAYFSKDGPGGEILQGGNTAGGIGIDAEFFETSLLPAVVVLGFLGIEPTPTDLKIEPRLPSSVPSMTLHGMRYRGQRMDVTAEPNRIFLRLPSDPPEALSVRLPAGWRIRSAPEGARGIDRAGEYIFALEAK